MEFYKQFLQSRGTPAATQPGMHLAIFGKHPGWDDHIPDVGSTTETLSILKRDFYVRGIGGLIDAGAWDKMQEDDILDGFNHLFLAQRGREGIVGRMWASTDGKGRARYPMVVAIHTFNIPLHKCLQELLWLLEKFREDCLSRTREREIIQVVNSAQEKLNAMSGEFSGAEPDSAEYAVILKRMLSAEGLDDSVRHSRLLYELKNKLEPFSPANNEKSLPEETVPGEHIRLPYAGELDEADAFIAWLTYLRTQISPRIPVFILKPVAGPWMDAIVGRLDGKQLLCLRSSLRHSPPVTELKYNIPAEFNESVQKQLSSIADWNQYPYENTVFEGSTKRRVLDPKITALDEGDGGFFSKPKNLILTVVVLLVLVAAAVFAVLILGSSGDVVEVEKAQPAQGQASKPLSDDAIQSDPSEALAYLADSESLWYPRLMRYTRNQSVKDMWNRDPDLAILINNLESSDLRTLIEKVGPVANISSAEVATLEPARAEAIVELSKAIRSIEKSLQNWTVSKDREMVRNFLTPISGGRLISEFDGLVPTFAFDDRLGEQIQNRLSRATFLSEFSSAIREFQANIDSVKQFKLESVARVVEWCDSRIQSSSSVEALSGNLNSLTRGLSPLAKRLGNFPLPDQQALKADPRHAAILAATSEQFDELTELIKDYQPIVRSEMPDMDIGSVYGRSDLDRDLGMLGNLDPDFNQDPFFKRWEDAKSQMEEVAQIPAIIMNATRIRERVNQVRAMVDSLKLDIGKALAERSDPSGWYTALKSMAFGNAAFNEAWQRRLDEVVAESMIQDLNDDNALFIRKRQEMETWRSLFEETLRVASTIGYPSAPDNASSPEKARNDWISEFHSMLVSLSLAGFLDELGVPVEEEIDKWTPFLQWKQEFDSQITAHYVALESELTGLEKDLNGRGTGDYAGLRDRVNKAWPSVELGADIQGLLQGLQALETVRKWSAPGDLIGVIGDADWPGQRWAAWRQLQALPQWPSTASDLNLLNRAGNLMLEYGLGQDSLKVELKSAWQSSIQSKVARSERLDLWEFHESVGWNPDELSDTLKYDRLIAVNLDKALLQMDRDEVVDLRDQLLSGIHSIESVSGATPVGGFLRELEILQFEDGKTIDRELLADAGPGSAGWKISDADPEGKWVIYNWRSENLRFDEGVDEYRMAFLLVEPFNQERFYLGADEVSAGAFFDWISESVGWDNFPHEIPQSAFGSESLQNDIAWRNGPRAWTLGTDSELYVARDWQIQSNTQEVPVQQDRDRRPSRFSPVNYISPATAVAWADAMNCRLPSPKEFTGLSSADGSVDEDSNLRDATWASHLQFIRQQLGAMNTSWPDNDCFIPAKTSVPLHADALPAVSSNDGVLWFTNVGADSVAPVEMRNVQGNMAEFVYDPQNAAYFVIGGSALSPSEVVWNAPYRVDGSNGRGYSDVGLRIAFDAPTPLPGRILLDALLNAPQLSLEN